MDSSPVRRPTRSVPMEILVLGLCRTGTMSTRVALEVLGYPGVYHFSSVYDHVDHADRWRAALEAKYEGRGRVFTLEQWDDLLGDYSAVTDIPAACFAPELLATYPRAKIILTTRPAAAWSRSMLATIDALYARSLRPWTDLFASAQDRSISRLLDLIMTHYLRPGGGSVDAEAYQRTLETHNARVRSLAEEQKRDFLEFRVEEGWGPLCAFLGRDVPEMQFPRLNDRASWRAHFKLGVLSWVVPPLAVLVVAVLIVLYSRSSS